MATKTKEHWAADEAARTRLLDFGHQHGLDGKGIVDVLGVEKLSDYTGTAVEATITLMEWARAQEPPDELPAPAYKPVELDPDTVTRYDVSLQGLASAPVWIKMDGRGYYEVSVQAWLPPELTHVGLTYARQTLEDYRAIFADVLLTNGNGQASRPAQATAPAAGGNGSGGDDNTFQATHLKATTINDKTYWNVLGPRFPQHGVRIWPEILEAAGFKEADLDTSQPIPLTGYTAIYVEKEKDGKMVTDKVISLTKAA